jgi:ribokinase
MNEAKTLRTELNSLETFKPEIPEKYKNAKYIFLANIDPSLQLEVIAKIKKPELILTDTMNFWIEHKKEDLLAVIKKTDILLLNDGEARQLFKTTNLVKAANKALKLGPKAIIIKKGEHGALLFTHNKHFNAPGYPLENIKDPTGCGDTFGGALIGYLAKTKNKEESNIRKAIIYASVLASHNAEDFSLEKLKRINSEDIEKRFKEFREMREF